MSDSACFVAGCGALDCTHLRWVDDGLGQWQQQCRSGCDMQVVRPGKFACSCDDERSPIHVAPSKEHVRLGVDRGPDQEDQ